MKKNVLTSCMFLGLSACAAEERSADPIKARLSDLGTSIMRSGKVTTDTLRTAYVDVRSLCEKNQHIPSSVIGYNWLAKAASVLEPEQERKYLEAAVARYEDLVRSGSATTETHLIAALCYRDLDRKKDVIQTLGKISRGNSFSSDYANRVLAEIYCGDDAIADARECFGRIRDARTRHRLASRFPALGNTALLREEMTSESLATSRRMRDWHLPSETTSTTSRSFRSMSPAQKTIAFLPELLRELARQLERFRLRYDRYPKSLEELPEGLGVHLPRDPYRPSSLLEYEILDGRVYLWSVGPNGKNDRHAVSWHPGRDDGDIVAWRPKE